MSPHQHVLYRFFDAAGQLLYVGITNNPEERIKQHRKYKPWWHKATTITLERFDTAQALAAAERTAIENERPRYNIQYATSSPETLKPAARAAESIAPDANHFHTQPPTELPDDSTRLRWTEPFPCPQCHSVLTYRYGQPNGQHPTHDEPIHCGGCGTTYDAETWSRQNGIPT